MTDGIYLLSDVAGVYLDLTTDRSGLSALAVALILTGLAVLATLAAYFAKRRESGLFFLWLAAIWPLACVLAFVLNPATWPNQTIWPPTLAAAGASGK